MSLDLTKFSIAKWFAERDQHKCGYCKSPSGSVSFGMLVEQLTAEDYRDLIDRGWRRSGKYCYKPTMDMTCCPQYTIRCNAIEFKLNKSHKKIIKKFNKFLCDGAFNKNVPPDQQDEGTTSEILGYNKRNTINLTKTVTTTDDSFSKLRSKDNLVTKESKELPKEPCKDCLAQGSKVDNDSAIALTNTSKLDKKQINEGSGPDPNRPPCKKAKLLRLERKKEKLLKEGQQFQPTNNASNEQKNLKQFLEEIPPNAKHKLKLKLISTSKCDAEWEAVKDLEFKLYVKYQTVVHNDNPCNLSMRSFTNFLVTSPIKPKPFPDDVEGPGYGSFHQQYWIDDKLIAVGVIDILPGCVSSVYFFYDPDYRDLTLGTYGSLRETQLVQDLHVRIPDLKYYYMGFYIHSCPKMRYKGRLNPSWLLCPETYAWIPIEKCLPKLDVNKYSRLNEDIDALDFNRCSSDDVNTIKVVTDYKLMHVKDFLRRYVANREEFENLANLVGRKSALNIIFWMD